MKLRWASSLLLVLLVSTACSSAAEDEESGSATYGSAYPATITGKFGDVTIDSAQAGGGPRLG